MVTLLIVGDGPRDQATIPPVVVRIIDAEVQAEFKAWKGIELAKKGYVGTRGYARKLDYAIRLARADKLQGVVAVVDRDNDSRGNRIKALKTGRDEAKEAVYVPTAVGEAIPHGEAWLLSDADAVKQGLNLSAQAQVLSPKKTNNPKEALSELHQNSPRSGDPSIEVLTDIARHMDPSRCRERKATGFKAFCGEVEAEIGPLAAGG